MQLKEELYFKAIFPALVVVLLSFGAISLFMRMSPAIETILEENGVSIRAVENMLVVLARAERGIAEDDQRRQFFSALASAEDNITEEEEVSALEDIRRLAPEALDVNISARNELIDQLQLLARINLSAMERSDQAAKQLGKAGA